MIRKTLKRTLRRTLIGKSLVGLPERLNELEARVKVLETGAKSSSEPAGSFINLLPPEGGAASANAFNIFKGHWAYEIPVPNVTTGTMSAFKHEPIGVRLIKEHFPNHTDFDVLELGSHEGEHSYHLNNLPVRHVYGIEGRPANFLKCLIVKNELGLNRVRFAVGDFIQYLRFCKKQWDLTYCCGVLYHMSDPAEVLRLISTTTKRLVLSTAIFDWKEMSAADERTKNAQFPTNWLRDINPRGYQHRNNEGKIYTYYPRTFHQSTLNTIVGHGNSHADHANLIDAHTLRKILEDLGGNILYWNVAPDERTPSAEAVIDFSHLHGK